MYGNESFGWEETQSTSGRVPSYLERLKMASPSEITRVVVAC